MKRSSVAVSFVLLLVFTICASLAYADTIVAKITFPFMAGGKEYPAGTYRIETSTNMDEITIRSEETGKGGIVPFETRLSSRDEDKATVVFDKAGDKYYMSEIYMPGIDGFEIKGATGKHTHVKVTATKK